MSNYYNNDKLLLQEQEIESLRQQLEASQKREVMLRYAVAKAAAHVKPTCNDLYEELMQALAATADLDGLILCKKKPTAWCQEVIYEMAPEFAFSWFNTQLHYLPLYRAWEPTK